MAKDVWTVYCTVNDEITDANTENKETERYETRWEAIEAMKELVKETAVRLQEESGLFVTDEDPDQGKVCATDGDFNYVNYIFQVGRTITAGV